jgi:hypothetical protein
VRNPWAGNNAADAPQSGLAFNVAGGFDDGWCAPKLTFQVAANRPVSLCQVSIWLPEGSNRPQLTFQVNNEQKFSAQVPRQKVVVLQFACPCPQGRVARVTVSCDSQMSNSSGDMRSLSFVLSNISFY